MRKSTSILLWSVLVVALGAAATDEPRSSPLEQLEQIDQARATLEKWVQTKRLVSQERLEGIRRRETLKDRIELVRREVDSLRAKIVESERTIAEADDRAAGLRAENDVLRQASASLGAMVQELEVRTRELLRRLPPPILERVKPISQRFPEDPASTRLPLSERFLNVVGVLNEVNKFNGAVTVGSEVRQLPDGTSAEVTALYVGIGQGYYVNAAGTIAGVGFGAPDGWTWTPANEAAPRIAAAIAILKNEQVASFVELPLRVQ